MFDELRHFLLIVDHGTFTQAARRAHLSQPALTASVRRLEDRLGTRLFHRGPSGASLTAEGRALLPHALAAIASVESGRRAVAEVAGLNDGEVRIGAGATAATYLLPPELAVFQKRHPKIRILLRETTTDEALDALAASDLDLAVVTVAPDRGEPWRDDPLVLVASPDVDPSTAPFLTFRRGTTSRRLFDESFPDARVVMELGSIAAVKGNVRAGIGIALVSRAAVESDLELGRLVLVEDSRTPIARTLSLVHCGPERLPPAAAALRAQLLSLAAAK